MGYLVIANWKSNLNRDDAANWLNRFRENVSDDLLSSSLQIAIAPSHTEISTVYDYLLNWNLEKRVYLMSQDLSQFSQGAHTGEVTTYQTKPFSLWGSIIGHSERRKDQQESDDTIVAKAQSALNASLQPVIAVSNLAQVESLSKNNLLNANSVIAYEPLESISSNPNSKPASVEQVESFTKQVISKSASPNIKVIYGGSVSAQDVGQYLQIKDIRGFLVGSASKLAESFIDLLNSINEIQRSQLQSNK